MRKYKIPLGCFDMLYKHILKGGDLDFTLIQPSGRARETIYAKRDLAIYQLHLNGMAAREISEFYAEQGWGIALSPEYVGTIIRRMRKKDPSNGNAFWKTLQTRKKLR
jgi:hypothetical protein